MGLVSVKEPFTNLLTQGMVCKEVYECPKDGYLYPHEAEGEGDQLRCRKCGGIVPPGRIEKMSKSKRNVVDPEYLIEKYGADTARMFCLFASPPEKDLDWSDQGVDGSARFLNRVWRLFYDQLVLLKNVGPLSAQAVLDGDQTALHQKTHKTIKKVTEDIERFHFNTGISAVMELVNEIYTSPVKEKTDEVSRQVMGEAIEAVVLLLSPFVPHFAEELWETLGKNTSILTNPWPEFDPKAVVEDEVLIVVQVNGKVRDRITVPASLGEEEMKSAALGSDRVQALIGGKQVKKVVLVPKKLVNIVCQ